MPHGAGHFTWILYNPNQAAVLMKSLSSCSCRGWRHLSCALVAIRALRYLTSSYLPRARWKSSSEHPHQKFIADTSKSGLLCTVSGLRATKNGNLHLESITLGANLEQKVKHKWGSWLEQMSLTGKCGDKADSYAALVVQRQSSPCCNNIFLPLCR